MNWEGKSNAVDMGEYIWAVSVENQSFKFLMIKVRVSFIDERFAVFL